MKRGKVSGTQPSSLQESAMSVELTFSRICRSQGDVPCFVFFSGEDVKGSIVAESLLQGLSCPVSVPKSSSGLQQDC